MKKLLAVLAISALVYSCTEAGEGSEVEKDTTATGTKKDTMVMTNSDGSTTSKDTTSFERMPNKTTGDTTRN